VGIVVDGPIPIGRDDIEDGLDELFPSPAPGGRRAP
jgi:hypothetical protein